MDKEEERYFDTAVPEADNYTEEVLDNIIGMNVTLQHNGKMAKSKIIKQAIGPDGNPTGKYNHDSILDSRKYEVGLPDGVADEYHHNIL